MRSLKYKLGRKIDPAPSIVSYRLMRLLHAPITVNSHFRASIAFHFLCYFFFFSLYESSGKY